MAPSIITSFPPSNSDQGRRRSSSSEGKDDPFVVIGQQKLDPWDVHPGKGDSHPGSPSYQPQSAQSDSFHFSQATLSSALKQKPFQPIRVRKGDGEKYSMRSPTSPTSPTSPPFFSYFQRNRLSVQEEKSPLNSKDAGIDKITPAFLAQNRKPSQSKHEADKPEIVVDASKDANKETLPVVKNLFDIRNSETETAPNKSKESEKFLIIPNHYNHAAQKWDSLNSVSVPSRKRSSFSPRVLQQPISQRMPSHPIPEEHVDLSETPWNPLEAEKPMPSHPRTRTTTSSSYTDPEPLLAPIQASYSDSNLDLQMDDEPLLPQVDTISLVASMERELIHARQRELIAVQQSLTIKAKVHELQLQNQQLNEHVAWLNSRICDEREQRVQAQVDLEALEIKWRKTFQEYQALKDEVRSYRLLRLRLDKELKSVSPTSHLGDIYQKKNIPEFSSMHSRY